MSKPVYALNLFNIASKTEYLAYAKRSVKEVKNHNGRVISLGKYRESVAGDMSPRQVFILVEWASKEAFDSYCNDPALADLHPIEKMELKIIFGNYSIKSKTLGQSLINISNITL